VCGLCLFPFLCKLFVYQSIIKIKSHPHLSQHHGRWSHGVPQSPHIRWWLLDHTLTVMTIQVLHLIHSLHTMYYSTFGHLMVCARPDGMEGSHLRWSWTLGHGTCLKYFKVFWKNLKVVESLTYESGYRNYLDVGSRKTLRVVSSEPSFSTEITLTCVGIRYSCIANNQTLSYIPVLGDWPIHP